MNRSGPVLSLVVAALLAAALAALWLAPGPQARWRQWQAPPPQAPQLDDVQAASLRANPAAQANYPAVVERPLFNPARRPQASASAAVAAPPAPSAIEQIRLQGLVAGPTLTGVMLQEDGKPRFVRVGEAVGGWMLERVQARAAVFARAGQQREIALEVAAGEGARSSAQPGGPAAAPQNGPSPQRREPGAQSAPTSVKPNANATAANVTPVSSASSATSAAPSGSGSAGARPAPAARTGSFGGSAPTAAADSSKPAR